MESVDDFTPLLLPGNPIYHQTKKDIPTWWLFNKMVPKAKREGKHIVAEENSENGRLEFRLATMEDIQSFYKEGEDINMEEKGIEGFF